MVDWSFCSLGHGNYHALPPLVSHLPTAGRYWVQRPESLGLTVSLLGGRTCLGGETLAPPDRCISTHHCFVGLDSVAVQQDLLCGLSAPETSFDGRFRTLWGSCGRAQ